MKLKRFSRKVNYYETDKMGIVHHSNYIRFFEEARVYSMNQMDCDVKVLEDFELIIPNVDAYARYLIPLRFGDTFTIDFTLTEFNGVKFTCEYKLYNQHNQLCTTGYTTHCFVNTELRPISIKRSNTEIYDRMKKYVVEKDK